ncbi:MAG: hypothetical protein Q9209_004269 [Squamulea sp. 1 TL-2023]
MELAPIFPSASIPMASETQARNEDTYSPTPAISQVHSQNPPSPQVPNQKPPQPSSTSFLSFHPEYLPAPHPPPFSSTRSKIHPTHHHNSPSPLPTFQIVELHNPSPPPNPPTFTLVTLRNKAKKDPETVTATITIHETIHMVSFATEKTTFTLTDTVFVNRTIFIHDTITHTASKPILTLNLTPSRFMLTTTKTITPTAMNICNSAAAAQSSSTPTVSETSRPNGAAIAGAVVGSLLGVALVMGAVWFGVRKWRAWKAKQNGHMKGVELQRRWEVEQEMRTVGEDV